MKNLFICNSSLLPSWELKNAMNLQKMQSERVPFGGQVLFADNFCTTSELRRAIKRMYDNEFYLIVIMRRKPKTFVGEAIMNLKSTVRNKCFLISAWRERQYASRRRRVKESNCWAC